MDSEIRFDSHYFTIFQINKGIKQPRYYERPDWSKTHHFLYQQIRVFSSQPLNYDMKKLVTPLITYGLKISVETSQKIKLLLYSNTRLVLFVEIHTWVNLLLLKLYPGSPRAYGWNSTHHFRLSRRILRYSLFLPNLVCMTLKG